MVDRPVAPSVELRPAAAPQLNAPQMRAAPQPAVEIAGQLGAGIEAAGLAGFSLATRAQEYVDDARAADADNKLAEQYRNLLWAPEQGYLHRVGEQAVQERENVLGALADVENALAEGMTPHQRARFQRLAWARRQQAQHAVDVHYARQSEVYYTGRAAARADGLFEDAVAAYFEPGGRDPGAAWSPAQVKPYAPATQPDKDAPSRYEGLKAAMRDQIRELAERTGQNVTGLLQERADALAETIAGRLVDLGRPDEAEAVLRHEGASQRLITKMAGSIERGRAQVQAAALAEEARTQAVTSGAGIGDQLRRVTGAQVSPAVKALAMKQILQDEQALHEARQRERRTKLQDAQTFSQLQPDAPLPTELQNYFDANPAAAAEYQLWIGQGKQYVTTDAGNRFLASVTDEILRKFPTFEALENVVGRALSPDDKRALGARWRSARQPGAVDSDVDKADEQRQVFAYLTSPGRAPGMFPPGTPLSGPKADPKLAWRVDQFRAAVQRHVNDRFARGAGKLSLGEERQKAMDAVWADGANVDGVWMPRVMMTSEELGRAQIPQVAFRDAPVTLSLATGQKRVTAPGFVRELPTPESLQAAVVARREEPTVARLLQELQSALEADAAGAAADRRAAEALRLAWRDGLQATLYDAALRAAQQAPAGGENDEEGEGSVRRAVVAALKPYLRRRWGDSDRGALRPMLIASLPPGATERDIDDAIGAVLDRFPPLPPNFLTLLSGAY